MNCMNTPHNFDEKFLLIDRKDPPELYSFDSPDPTDYPIIFSYRTILKWSLQVALQQFMVLII